AALEFHAAYLAYLAWQDQPRAFDARRDAARTQLRAALEATPGDVTWLVRLAHRQGLDAVTLDEFWPGSARVGAAVRVAPAYTVAGHAFIQSVLGELDAALAGENAAAQLAEALDGNYRAAYLDAWRAFANRFDDGMQRLARRDDWIALLNQFPLDANP